MYIRLPQAFNQTHETIQSGLDRVVFLFVIEFFLVPILRVFSNFLIFLKYMIADKMEQISRITKDCC